MDVTDNIAQEFTLSELNLVAEEIGLAPTKRWTSRMLIDLIKITLKRDGIPKPPPDDEELTRGQELLDDFLYVAGYIDDQGQPLGDYKEQGVLYATVDDFMLANDVAELPGCYSYADDKDPSCARCLLFLWCAAERIQSLPACYGLLWQNDNDATGCMGCMESPFCKEAFLKFNKSKEVNTNGSKTT